MRKSTHLSNAKMACEVRAHRFVKFTNKVSPFAVDSQGCELRAYRFVKMLKKARISQRPSIMLRISSQGQVFLNYAKRVKHPSHRPITWIKHASGKHTVFVKTFKMPRTSHHSRAACEWRAYRFVKTLKMPRTSQHSRATCKWRAYRLVKVTNLHRILQASRSDSEQKLFAP